MKSADRTRPHSAVYVLLLGGELGGAGPRLPGTRIGPSGLPDAALIGVVVLVRIRAQWAYVLVCRGLTADLTLFLHRDALGSVTAATNAAGQVVFRNSYRAFGERTQSGVASGVVPSRLSYTSRENSIGSLYQYRSRHYDSGVGRFLSQDRYRGEGVRPPSLHRYTYVHNNPLNYADPTGQWVANAALAIVFLLLAGQFMWFSGESMAGAEPVLALDLFLFGLFYLVLAFTLMLGFLDGLGFALQSIRILEVVGRARLVLASPLRWFFVVQCLGAANIFLVSLFMDPTRAYLLDDYKVTATLGLVAAASCLLLVPGLP